MIAIVACGTNRDLIVADQVAPSVSATPVARIAIPSTTPLPATAPRRPTAAPTAIPPPFTPIAGLFLDARPAQPVTPVVLPALPAATIALDVSGRANETLVFDTETQSVTNLQRGFRGSFSPDGTRMSWIRITPQPWGELMLLDLVTGERRLLGVGLDSAPWIDEDTLLSVDATARARTAVDVATGRATAAPTFDPASQPFASEVRAGLRLVPISDGPPAAYELRRIEDDVVLLRFEAEAASFAADRELVVATPAGGTDLSANIFLVDVDGASATFVASTRLAHRPLIALSANDEFVVWSDRFCSADGTTHVYERATSEVRAYNGAGWSVITPAGLLAIGEFGAHALFDLGTGSYTTVLPSLQQDVSWSPDFRYASVGAELEHSSRCPS